jgi:hypothetical protein
MDALPVTSVSTARRPRHVAEADGADPPACVPPEPDAGPPGRHVDAERARVGRHQPGVGRPGGQGYRAVAAGGGEAGLVEEDRAELRALVVGRGDEASVHPAVAARLLDEQPAHVVEASRGMLAPLGDARAGQAGNAAGHDAERLARGVIVDGADEGGALGLAH